MWVTREGFSFQRVVTRYCVDSANIEYVNGSNIKTFDLFAERPM